MFAVAYIEPKVNIIYKEALNNRKKLLTSLAFYETLKEEIEDRTILVDEIDIPTVPIKDLDENL